MDVASDRKTISVNCDLKDERKDYLVPARRIFFHGAVEPRVENKNRKARFHRAVISPDLVTPGLAADSFRAPAILGNSACRRPTNLADGMRRPGPLGLRPAGAGDRAMTIRPRRSMLYMPGSNARAIEKAMNCRRTASSSISRMRWRRMPRQQARELVVRGRSKGRLGRPRVWSDQRARYRLGRDGPWSPLPSPTRCCCRRSPRPTSASGPAWSASAQRPNTCLWAMMETPLAMLNAARDRRRGAHAAAACRLRHGHQRSRQGDARATIAQPAAPPATWLSRVTAARAYGLDMLDGVYNNFKRRRGLPASACRRAISVSTARR